MLQQIRERVTGWIAWGVIILIGIPFAMWGMGEYFGGAPETVVAQVNDSEISAREFRRAYQMQRQQLRAQDDYDPSELDDEQLRQSILDNLVNEELLAQAAGGGGLRISDPQLAAQIRELPAFQQDGRFSRELYERNLRAQGLSPDAFEQRLRRSMLVNQIQRGVSDTVPVSDALVDNFIRMRDQERSVKYLGLERNRYLDEVDLTEADFREFYEYREELFREPERLRVAYIELSEEAVGAAVEPDEDELKRMYEERVARAQEAERRRAAHILIQVPGDADEEQEAEARSRLETVLAELDDDVSFESLAEEYSDDPGSADDGGDLGWVDREMMGRTFEEALYNLESEGDVSEPIRTRFGYHLIKLTEIDRDEVESFESMRDELIERYRERAAERKYYEHIDRLADLTFEHDHTLDVAADELGLEVRRTDWFSRDGADDGIARHREVVEAAFSDDVLEHGFNSEPIELTEGHLVVLRLEERLPPRLPPYDEIQDTVKEEARLEAASRRMHEHAETLISELAEGIDPERLAEQQGVSLIRAGSVRRDDLSHAYAVIRTAFELGRPDEEGEPLIGGTTLHGGDYAVVIVDDVKDGDPDAISPQERQALKRSLAQLYGMREYQVLVEDLRDGARIRIRDDQL